jgi:hypothetical protein
MSAQLEDFDSSKYYLGTLCKRGHDWNGTGMSLRQIKYPRCWECAKENLRKQYQKRTNSNLRRAIGVICPVCKGNTRYLVLESHTRQRHNITVLDMPELGVNNFVAPHVRKARHLSGKNRTYRENLNETLLTVKGHDGKITIPASHWPRDCKYYKVEFDKPSYKIYFLPVTRKLPFTRLAHKHKKGVV